MSLTQDPRNVLALARRIFTGAFTQGPTAPPSNVARGGTRGGPQNYGVTRQAPVYGAVDVRPWVNPNLRPFESPRRR